MQSVSLFYFALCAVAPFTVVAHHSHSHSHSHHKPSGYRFDQLNPTSGILASGTGTQAFSSSSAPYPAGNGTIAGPTGTASHLLDTSYTSTVQSTIYVTSPGNGESQSASSSFGGSAEVASSTGLPLSENPGGPGEGASSCEAPAVVTVTGTTVTITKTLAASSSQTLLQSESSAASRASTQSSASSQSSFSADPIASETAIPSQSTVSTTPIPEKLAIRPSSSQVTPTGVSTGAVVPTSSTAAASNAPTNSLSTGTSGNALTPNGKKAGVAGYQSITEKTSWNQFTSHLGWYSDYWPNTPDSGAVSGIGMLWGDGHQGGGDAERLAAFKALTATPKYMMGFYEPDFHPPDSSDISSTSAASTWSSLIAPLGTKGTLLGSPSLATQKDESWLTPFEDAPEHPKWDYTCIHTNKPNVTGVKEDVEYYLQKYKKPIWVSEFACVDDQTWTPCTDPVEIKTFIQDVVAFLQANESVIAYGYSNGDGLGSAWPMIDSSTGTITASGQVYLDVISAL